MSQSTVLRILSIEREATRIHDEAAAQATQMVADFERESSATRQRVLAEARRQAVEIERNGQQMASERRAQILAQAEAEASEMEALASTRLSAAVQYVLDQVTGRS